MAFDLMCADGELLYRLRSRNRRAHLESIVNQFSHIAISSLDALKQQAGLFHAEHPFSLNGYSSPSALASEDGESAEGIDQAYRDARARANEGVMIKAAGSAYLPGRRGLAWLKLKRELATLDVVITGAEYGHGRRAGF